jgi:hypothetical protein
MRHAAAKNRRAPEGAVKGNAWAGLMKERSVRRSWGPTHLQLPLFASWGPVLPVGCPQDWDARGEGWMDGRNDG